MERNGPTTKQILSFQFFANKLALQGHGRPKHSKKPTTEATTESAPPATPEAAPATPEAAPAAAPAVAARSAEPEPLDVLASLSHASDGAY